MVDLENRFGDMDNADDMRSARVIANLRQEKTRMTK